MNEPTIHLAPVTQILDDGDAYFVGIPVTPERIPTHGAMFGTRTECARSVFLGAVVDHETQRPGVGVYVHDHHGLTMLSNVIHDVPIFGDFALNLN